MTGKFSPAQAVWSRSVTGAVVNGSINRGVVVFGVNPTPYGNDSTQALDLLTGRRLWERTGQVPLTGSPSFLADREAVDRVDTSTGRIIWRSVPICTSSIYPWMRIPSYVAIIRDSVFVGCNGGKLVGLRFSDGRVFAVAHPVNLAGYDQIVDLGQGALGIGGWADGAHMQRHSAIVKQNNLGTIVALPNQYILGAWNGRALVEIYDWASDAATAHIALVSVTSGETLLTANLDPHPQPEPVVVLLIGNTLYLGTRTAVFAYDLRNLVAQPRVLYEDLSNLPTVIDDRYLSIERIRAGGVRSNAILDGYHDMRLIHSGTISAAVAMHTSGTTKRVFRFANGRVKSATVDATCAPAAFDENYVFMACGNDDVASRIRVGIPSNPLTLKDGGTMMPGSIAVYALAAPRP